MDPLLIIGILLLVGVALLIVLYPLWQQRRPQGVLQVRRTGQTLEETQARYQAVLASIKDLMFDYEMGKVSEDDYEALLTDAKLEAAKIRQQLDQLSSESTDSRSPNAEVDAQIESLIAQFRNGAKPPAESLRQEVEAEIEMLKAAQPPAKASARPACNACGSTLRPDDLFCSRCGQPVTGTQPKVDASPNVCLECGYTFQPGDAFCVNCGAALPQTESVEKTKI